MAYPIKLSDISNTDDLLDVLKLKAFDKLSIVVFSAEWCNPCRTLKKRIYDDNSKKGMSTDFKDDAVFFYVDIDKNKELAEELSITNIPCVHFMKGGKHGLEMIDQFTGGGNLTDQKIRMNL